MKQYLLLLLIVLGATLTGKSYGSTPTASNKAAIPDSLLQVSHIRKAAMSDPDEALSLLDEAERRATIPLFQINWTRAQIYGGAKKMERMAAKYGRLVLEDDSVRDNPQYYFNMCKNLIESMIATGDYEEAMRYARSMVDVIERSGNSTSNHHNAYWAMARVYRAMGDTREAYEYMDKAIRLCREQLDIKRKREHPLVSDELKLQLYLRNNSEWLAEDGTTQEALRLALQMQEGIERLRPLKGGPFPKQIPEKAFRAKEGFVAGRLANLYHLTGEEAKGKEWFAKMQENPLAGQDAEMLGEEIRYYKCIKAYDRLIEKALPLVDAAAYTDSIDANRQKVYQLLADTYRHLGRPTDAAACYEMALMLADSLNRRNHESDALELATLLETHDKERQLERKEEELRWHRAVIYVVVGVLLLVAAILLLMVRHSRIVTRKNKVMAKQIDLYLSYRNELQAANEQIRRLEEAQAQPVEPAPSDAEEVVAAADLDPVSVQMEENGSDRRYFEEWDRKIRSEKLFLDSDLSRDDLLRLTPVGKNRVSSFVQVYTGETIKGYINNLRLEYSLTLLKEQEHFTIEAVAMDSGFNNVRTYQRIFRERYGMSPAEYRKTQKE